LEYTGKRRWRKSRRNEEVDLKKVETRLIRIKERKASVGPLKKKKKWGGSFASIYRKCSSKEGTHWGNQKEVPSKKWSSEERV